MSRVLIDWMIYHSSVWFGWDGMGWDGTGRDCRQRDGIGLEVSYQQRPYESRPKPTIRVRLGHKAISNIIPSMPNGRDREIQKCRSVLERELNEFIAHEVRNTLSSAIAALSFVSAAAAEPDTDRESLLSDIKIIDVSLQFINELLRNMLDLHRSADNAMSWNPWRPYCSCAGPKWILWSSVFLKLWWCRRIGCD
jgi:signal transduction histidine kinase